MRMARLVLCPPRLWPRQPCGGALPALAARREPRACPTPSGGCPTAVPRRCCAATAAWGARAAAPAGPPPLQEVFSELRAVRPPYDTERLAELVTVAVLRREEMDPKQVALLLHRLGDLQWHSSVLCEAGGKGWGEGVK